MDGHLAASPGCTQSVGRSGLTRPEAAAQRAAELEALDAIIRAYLSRRQMRLVVARYVQQRRYDTQVARRLGLNRNYVGLAYCDLLDQLHKMLLQRLSGNMPVGLIQKSNKKYSCKGCIIGNPIYNS